jgi:hypothetical protein
MTRRTAKALPDSAGTRIASGQAGKPDLIDDPVVQPCIPLLFFRGTRRLTPGLHAMNHVGIRPAWGAVGFDPMS